MENRKGRSRGRCQSARIPPVNPDITQTKNNFEDRAANPNFNPNFTQNKNNFEDKAAGDVDPLILDQTRARLLFEPVDAAIFGCANCKILNDKIFDQEVEIKVAILQRRGLVNSLQQEIEYHKSNYNKLAKKHNDLITYHHSFLNSLLRESREVAAAYGHHIDNSQFTFPPSQ